MAKAVYLLDIAGGVSFVEALKCGECKAIVANDDMSDHLDWHAGLPRVIGQSITEHNARRG